MASVTDCPDVPQGGIAAECVASTGFLGFSLCVIGKEEFVSLCEAVSSSKENGFDRSDYLLSEIVQQY